MAGYSDDSCISPVVRSWFQEVLFTIALVRAVHHPSEVRAYVVLEPCLCRFVYVTAVLCFTVSFAPCDSRRTRVSVHGYWDIHLLIGAVALLCLPREQLFENTSCEFIPSQGHSLLTTLVIYTVRQLLFSSSWRLQSHPLKRVLCVRQLALITMSIAFLVHLELIAGSDKTFWS